MAKIQKRCKVLLVGKEEEEEEGWERLTHAKVCVCFVLFICLVAVKLSSSSSSSSAAEVRFVRPRLAYLAPPLPPPRLALSLPRLGQLVEVCDLNSARPAILQTTHSGSTFSSSE